MDAVLACAPKGFYVDVGANDPIELSNTKTFSLRGWTGINIESDPDTFHRVANDRAMDTNPNIGVDSSPEY